MSAGHNVATSDVKPGVYFLLGNLLPSFGLLLLLRGPQIATWQSGELHDYAGFLLSSRAGVYFLPFLVYAIACFTLGLFRPEVACRSFVVRAGIYSGIVLAIQYEYPVGMAHLPLEEDSSSVTIAAITRRHFMVGSVFFSLAARAYRNIGRLRFIANCSTKVMLCCHSCCTW